MNYPISSTQLKIVACIIAYFLFLPPAVLANSLLPANWLFKSNNSEKPSLDGLLILFQANGQPYNQPIEFEISCYGNDQHETQEINRNPQRFYFLSGICKTYGCGFDFVIGPTSPVSSEIKAWNIEQCTIEGKTENTRFVINNLFEIGFPNSLPCTRSRPASCQMEIDLTTHLKTLNNFFENFSQDGVIGIDELFLLLSNWGRSVF
jgi:hypothetical protein